MRDIKFRAWDKSRNQWSEQSFAIDQEGDVHMWREIGGGPSYAYGHSYINPIICMYTGLKDKNGKEIYEGDILRLTSKAPHVDVLVRWDDKFGGFTTGTEDEETFSHMYGSHLCEVIGNIYENPELLQEQS